jgi:ATP-dependent DNA helicase RecG
VQAAQALALPREQRGRALLRLPEDQWFDRKSRRISGRDLADVLIGFANAEGGLVVLGLWGSRIEGIGGTANKQNEWRQAAADFTLPTVPSRHRLVECVNEAGEADALFVVEVEPSDRIHSNKKDEVYLRVGDENRRLTFMQRQELLYDKGQASYEVTPIGEATVEDLYEDLLASYAAAVSHPDPKRLLRARGLIDRRDNLTIAAVLLFAEHPQQWIPEASIRILRYRGMERGTGARQQLLEDIRIDGPVPMQLNAAQEAIFRLLPTRRALAPTGRFERIGLIPRDAWLEGLVNAAIHRSYSISGDHIRIEIFDDRIEVESPGRFPGISDMSNPLKVTRFARNPRIARVCADLDFGQELGEGIRRIFEEMRLAGLADPEYRQTSGSVRLVLTSTPIDVELESRLPRGARDLVRIVREAGRISTGDLVQASGYSRPAVVKQLNALKDVGLIEWIGKSPKDPRAYWQLKREERPTAG